MRTSSRKHHDGTKTLGSKIDIENNETLHSGFDFIGDIWFVIMHNCMLSHFNFFVSFYKDGVQETMPFYMKFLTK